MLSKRDIHAITLYEFKWGTNATKTTQKINETLGEDFNGSLKNKERGRPRFVLYNNELRNAVEANPRTSVKKPTKELNVYNQPFQII
uniref:HTH_48 domain-containing protein n=1 Tax=Strongyloides venezuelensis TaxID=75913 RepID=A0A0K0F1G7_STRVS